MKKITLLLASALAAVGIVGGTVAAYIVTSADTLGARVTPGDLPEDADGHITLKWDEKKVTPVSGLTVGAAAQNVFEVTLGSESTDISASELATYKGVFSLEIDNLSNLETGVPDLLNFLDVTVLKNTETVTLTDDKIDAFSGEKYTVKVALAATGKTGTPDEGKDTVLVYDVLKTQIAYFSIGWGPNSQSTPVENAGTVYFTKPTGWDELWLYAYKGTTIIGEFPGKQMKRSYTSEGGEVYAYELEPAKYTTYVFNDGTHNNEVTATVDATKAAKIKDGTEPYFNGTTWAAKPDVKLATYYLRGNIGGVNYWDVNAEQLALHASDDQDHPNQHVIQLHLDKDDEIRGYAPAGGTWYGPENNYLITESGTYNVFIDPTHPDESGDWGAWVNHMLVQIVK